jgi:mRNA interferase MazF
VAVKRGDIAIVTYGELGRPRPAVVVQADELGYETVTVLMCPITSEVTENLPIRPVLEPSSGSGLRLRSQIMTDKTLAVPRHRIRRAVGSLDAAAVDRLNRALLIVLGLAR